MSLCAYILNALVRCNGRQCITVAESMFSPWHADKLMFARLAGWQLPPGAGARLQVVHLRLQPAAARLHQRPGPRLVVQLHAGRAAHGRLGGWQLLHQLLPVHGAPGWLWRAVLHVPTGVGPQHRLKRSQHHRLAPTSCVPTRRLRQWAGSTPPVAPLLASTAAAI